MTMPRLVGVSVLTLLLGTSTLLAADRPPNVVFLLADDLGYGDLHCYGHPYSRTPHLDQLAAEGSRFCQFYSNGVTCCPARTALMTSRFCAEYAVYPANGGFGNRITVTELLKRQGYATGHFGKWHIGPVDKPGTYGIDFIVADAGEEKAAKKRNEKADTRGRDASIYDSAIAFIEKNKDQPFYVNVWGHISHHPVDPPADLVERWKDLKVDEHRLPASMGEKIAMVRRAGGSVDAAMARYLADVESLDTDVGRLLNRIDELGLKSNTIVVFSSDQGASGFSTSWGVEEQPQPSGAKGAPKQAGPLAAALDKADDPKAFAGDVRLNLMGSNGDSRGGKHNDLEGGVRVPFIIRWPGHVEAGRVETKSVMGGVDWLPSLCHIAGASINPADFDGEDASASWLGRTEHVRIKPLMWKTSTPNSDAAIRDGVWKLHSPSKSRRGEVQLYDISDDPLEQRNVASANPDIVKRLSAKLDTWRATLPKEYTKTRDKQD